MSYYQGDFYQGDPFFGGLFRAIGGVAKGLLGVGGARAPKMLPPQSFPGLGGLVAKIPQPVRGVMTRAGTMIAKHPVLSAAGAAGTIGVLGGAMGHPVLSGAAATSRGFHVSRRTGKMVRNRRMRVTNVRALRRAIRRCTGFAHLAKRVLRFTSPRPPRGRAVFKHRRRTKKI